MNLNENALLHFLDLARSGRRRGCSGGELRARKLALAVLAQVPGLDQEATEGLCEFIRVCLSSRTKAEELLS